MYYVQDSEGWETKPREAIQNVALIVEINMYITGYWQSEHLVKSFLNHRKVNNTSDLILQILILSRAFYGQIETNN